MKKFYIIINLFIIFSLHDALAQPADTSRPKQVTAHNVLYVEGAGMIVTGSISLNYERSLTENIWLRLGYGIGGEVLVEHPGKGEGPMLMIVYLPSGTSVEFGLGGSFINIKNGYRGHNWWLFPSASFGYRYQPADGGLLFRVGMTFTYRFCFPIEISLGYAF